MLGKNDSIILIYNLNNAIIIQIIIKNMASNTPPINPGSVYRGVKNVSKHKKEKNERQSFFGGIQEELEDRITQMENGETDDNSLSLDEAKDLRDQIIRIEKMASAEARVQAFAKIMDSGVPWDAIIGLIPGIGDGATALVQLYPLMEAVRFRDEGITKMDLFHMLRRVGMDFLIGLTPVIGDFFDWLYKASRGNSTVFQKRLEEAMEKIIRENWDNKDMMAQILDAKKQGIILLERLDVQKIVDDESTKIA